MNKWGKWATGLWAAGLAICPSALLANENDIFGYLQFNIDRTYRNPNPNAATGQIARERPDPVDYRVLRLNLMVRSTWDQGFTTFLNLSESSNASSGSSPTFIVRNAWGELPLPLSLGYLRVGKIYRPFSPYNERLDAVPTYLGVEPPEIFDTDHLFMSRFCDVMVHNSANLGPTFWSFAMTTNNPESRLKNGNGDSMGSFPLGWDVKMEMGNHKFMLGHSGFLSGPTGPATALGSSATGGITPPEGGVAPWMKSDNYSAWGLFSEWNPGNWQFEGGVFEAHHRAVRNATAVNNMITNAGLLPDQLARYQAAPGGNVVYNIKTYYLRAGYSIFTKAGEFVPYAFWDAYKNPEIIGLKAFGGDDEAGNFDGGKFTKDTVGLAYRPNPNVAIKVDHSFHFFKLLGRKTDYHEYRIDLSYFFGV